MSDHADSTSPDAPPTTRTKTPEGPPSVQDSTNTPSKSSAAAVVNAPNPPEGKELNNVITGLEAMHIHCSELDVEEFFKEFVPGKDPSGSDYEQFYNIASMHMKKRAPEWRLNTEICELARSVLERACEPGSSLPPLVIRDVSDWQKSGDGIVNSEKGTRCDSAVFFEDDRYKEHVLISPEKYLKSTTSKDDEVKDARKDLVGQCSYADIVVPIEVKMLNGRSAFEFNPKRKNITREHTNGGLAALGQFGHYIATVFGRQHRTHVLSLYACRDQARMVFTDRDVCIVSKAFTFGTTKDPTLHRFFWRLARLTRKDLGYDLTVTRATHDEFMDMYRFAVDSKNLTPYEREALFYALCVKPPKSKSSGTPSLISNQWPLQRMTRRDGTHVFVGRPKHASGTLLGRSTRGFAGFLPLKPQACFVKDSWRIDHEEVHPEHLVYEKLKANNVTHIPECLGGEDVGESTEHGKQETLTKPQVLEESSAFPCKTLVRFARIHYRLFMNKILRPLTDFRDFSCLPPLLYDSLSAHRDAWNAGVLHRDISVGNIMIDETFDEKGVLKEEGVLCDWDLCKYKDQMNNGRRTADRTGTWYFRSALSLQFPLRPYEVSDDIESFVWALQYLVLRFHQTLQTRSLVFFVGTLFQEEAIVDNGEGETMHVGGGEKLKHMRSGVSPATPVENETLEGLLDQIADVCRAHYAAVKAKSMKSKRGETGNTTAKGPGGTSLPRLEALRKPQANNDRLMLETHEMLLALFKVFTEYTWPDQDRKKSEDQFLELHLAPHNHNDFSETSKDPKFLPDLKKRKLNDGSALGSVPEDEVLVPDPEPGYETDEFDRLTEGGEAEWDAGSEGGECRSRTSDEEGEEEEVAALMAEPESGGL